MNPDEENDNENIELGYDLQQRSFAIEFREDAEEGIFEGIAVPWDQTVSIGGKFKERFKRGSIDTSERISIYRDHKELIGHVLEAEDREEGFWIKAKVALTSLGKDTLALLRSGALASLSVGFVPITNERDGDVVVRSRVSLREVSVVERPAYSLANVLAVREETTEREPLDNTQGETVTDTVSSAELTEVRGQIEELEQRVSMLPATAAPAVEKVETRTVGEIAKAIAERDEDTIAYVSEIQERAYTGGTSADSPIKDAWVGDLTRIYDASSGVLAAIFAKGNLPETGMNVEFAELGSNTVAFGEQAGEGDDLAFGKVTLTTRSAPVKTYGGYTQLTVQEIKRSTLPILNRHFEAMAAAAGARAKAALRTEFNTVRAAQVTASNIVTLGEGLDDVTAAQWADLVVDAAIAYEAKDATFDALVVSPAVFKHLNSLVIDGNKVFKVASANTLGTLDLPGLSGDLAGVTVVADTGATGNLATFVNGRAIRQYQSGMVSLQDENIINLSKTFSAYKFGAVASEIPGFIVPVTIPANDA